MLGICSLSSPPAVGIGVPSNSALLEHVHPRIYDAIYLILTCDWLMRPTHPLHSRHTPSAAASEQQTHIIHESF